MRTEKLVTGLSYRFPLCEAHWTRAVGYRVAITEEWHREWLEMFATVCPIMARLPEGEIYPVTTVRDGVVYAMFGSFA